MADFARGIVLGVILLSAFVVVPPLLFLVALTRGILLRGVMRSSRSVGP